MKTARKPPTERNFIQSSSELKDGDTTAKPKTPKSSHVHDHPNSTLQSPRTIKRRLDIAYDQVDNLNKKVKTLQQKSRRLSKKVSHLQEVVNTLRKENRVSTNAAEMLSKTFADVPADMMTRMVANKSSGHVSRKRYPPALRAFALTLHFYSAKAYKYVRKSFDFALPHPSVIKRWYMGMNGEPGFTEESFSALKIKADQAKEKGDEVVCALMLDEMAIKKTC